jgi:hypothetical protein
MSSGEEPDLGVRRHPRNDDNMEFMPGYTLWLINIAMENGPFIGGSPIKNGEFPWLC